ncbi:MAG TPA: PDZ domain-containing protein, partial [Acidimicrobiia bacterium]|nr:PDZ domain-containing protein [Acidimicrobiia bacterium]
GDGGGQSATPPEKAGDAAGEGQVRIDLDGIAERVVAVPVPEGRYSQVVGIEGKILLTGWPVQGSLGRDILAGPGGPRGSLESYDLAEQRHEVLTGGISSFEVSRDGHTLAYRSGRRLRVVKAGDKPPEGDDGSGRRSGWLDLDRVRVSVDPGLEWGQMFKEAWRLQRDHFWVGDMSGVDWWLVLDRYVPLINKVATRVEFSDLVWEMQGELGTSHAYELGGDYRPAPAYAIGHLAADLVYDAPQATWRFGHVVAGDPWDPDAGSPLRGPGVGVQPGDRLLAVNGRAVGAEVTPASLLVNQAGLAVELTVAGADGGDERRVVVPTLRDERPARYREWVENNRRAVHEATGGRVGYVHVPDMGPRGYAEFHRSYLAEVEREALVVDVRFNGGGHVSQLVREAGPPADRLRREPVGAAGAVPGRLARRATRGPHERARRLGRRHLHALLQAARPRPRRREADVGRGGGDLAPAHAGGREPHNPARVRLLVLRRRLGRRELRHGPGRRGRHPPAGPRRRAGPPARAGDRPRRLRPPPAPAPGGRRRPPAEPRAARAAAALERGHRYGTGTACTPGSRRPPGAERQFLTGPRGVRSSRAIRASITPLSAQAAASRGRNSGRAGMEKTDRERSYAVLVLLAVVILAGAGTLAAVLTGYVWV